MNDNSLHQQLDQEARRLPVTSTGIEVIIDTATGRTRRRRGMAAVGGVLAITATTVVGVQQLSRVDDASTPLDAPDTIVDTAVDPDATSPTSPDTTAPSGVPVTSVVLVDAVARPAILDTAVAATPSEPVITWRVVDIDSPEGLSLRYGGASQRYVLSTYPTTSGGNKSLFERRDGEWVEVARDVLPDGLRQATVSGDTIYAVGTAPATAGADRGSVGSYDIVGGTWSLLELPEEVRPYRSAAVSTSDEMSITPIDGGALIAISRWGAYLDWRLVEERMQGRMVFGDPEVNDGVVEIPYDCDMTAIDAIVNSAGENGEDSEDAWRAASRAHCSFEQFAPADLGMTAEDQAMLAAPRSATLWRFDGSSLMSVALPDPAAQGVRFWDDTLVTEIDGAQRAWHVNPDGSFTELFPELDGAANSLISIDGELAAVGTYSVIATQPLGGDLDLVDLTPVVTDETMQNPLVWANSVAATDSARVAIVNVEYDAIGTLTGPVSFADSGYELVVASDGSVTVVEQASGRQLSGNYRLATESGSVRLIGYEGSDEVGGTVPTTTTIAPATTAVASDAAPVTVGPPATYPYDPGAEVELAEFAVDPLTLQPWAHRNETRLVSSVDGRSFAVEIPDDLVEAVGDERIQLGSVKVVDGQFVVSGWTWRPDGGPEERRFVLIGTPTS